MSKIDRRTLLKGTLVAGASLGLSAVSWNRVARAHEDLRIACVGIRGRGNAHVRGFTGLPGVRVVALCDVDRGVLDRRKAELLKDGHQAETYVDFRELLEKAEVDAVSIATPNHWHALQAIWAIQAGKDVYVEKPVSHNVWEGRQIVDAAREGGRIVQTGTQARSSRCLQEAMAWLHEGGLGRIEVARGLCYKPRQSIGKVTGPQPVPDSIDYDRWVGPSPMVPLRRRSLHYDWHWDFATGCGDVGNQGIHQMDIARWALGESAVAPRVSSLGGRLGYDDDGNTPNTQVVVHEYQSAPLVFEVRGLPRSKEFQAKGWSQNMDQFHGARIGVLIHCEGGLLRIASYSSVQAVDPAGKVIEEFKGGGDHLANFVQAVRSGKAADLNADIEVGHVSSALCHLGNVSHRVGSARSLQAIGAELEGGSAAHEAFTRMAAHLEANGVDPARDSVVHGATLDVDPTNETIRATPGGPNQLALANSLLRRNDREPYVVPGG